MTLNGKSLVQFRSVEAAQSPCTRCPTRILPFARPNSRPYLAGRATAADSRCTEPHSWRLIERVVTLLAQAAPCDPGGRNIGNRPASFERDNPADARRRRTSSHLDRVRPGCRPFEYDKAARRVPGWITPVPGWIGADDHCQCFLSNAVDACVHSRAPDQIAALPELAAPFRGPMGALVGGAGNTPKRRRLAHPVPSIALISEIIGFAPAGGRAHTVAGPESRGSPGIPAMPGVDP